MFFMAKHNSITFYFLIFNFGIIIEMKISKTKIEAQQLEKLKTNLQKTDTERFLMTTQLMKIGIMLKNAKVTHKPYSKK